jgi:phosphodiesterase/alkaline phosphatase D-like protein
LADVLRTVHRRGVTGLVFLTADVHYTAAHHYDPAPPAVGDFGAFWEVVSGPAKRAPSRPERPDVGTVHGGRKIVLRQIVPVSVAPTPSSPGQWAW